MTIDLKLESMTLAEKLTAMELLWTDLTSESSMFPSPPWHGSVLSHRKLQAAAGLAQFQDWKATISKLKDELHANPDTGKRGS